MQETRYNCFLSKNVARPFFRRKQLSTSAEMQQQRNSICSFRHSCLNVFARRRVVLRFSTRNNCSEFLAFYGVVTQSVIQSFLKTPVCGASLSHKDEIFQFFLLSAADLWRNGLVIQHMYGR